MKKIVMTGLLMMSVFLGACSQEEQNVEVVVSTSAFPLIPATAVSCYARATADGTPIPDIEPDYFRIPTITFNRKDTSKKFIVSVIKVTINIPGQIDPYVCPVGADALAALNDTWFATSTKEAEIGKGVTSFATNCAMYCGGVTMRAGMTASGVMDITGLERDDNGDETPVKASTTITIQSL